jgi:uncharacterized membrane protein
MTALGLRLYNLDQESLWLDEIGQVLVAKNSWWLTVLSSAKHYGNTPLDYLVTHFTLYVGQSEAVLRLPAVIWGVLSIIVVYRLGRDMFDKPTGYLAASLLTITPLHVYYSREVRFYSLATFLALVSIYAFRQAVDKNTRRSWVLCGAVHVLALYAHYYTLIVIAVQGVWLLWTVYTKRYARSTFVNFVFAVGFALLLFLPWLCYDVHYEQVYKQGFLDTGFGFRFPSPISLLGCLFFFEGTPLSFAEPGIWWASFVWGTILIGGLAVLFRRPSRLHFMSHMTVLLILLVLGGTTSVLILDYLTSYFFAPRQFVIYTPLLLLATSAIYLNMVRFARSRLTKNLKAGTADRLAIVLLMLFSLWALWQPLTGVYGRHKADWRGTARYLMRYLRSDDVLVTPTPSRIGFYVPELSSQITKLKKKVPPLLQTAQAHSRVWILGTDFLLKGRYPDVHQWIQQERPIEVSSDPRLRLYVYSVNTPSSQLLEQLLRSRAYTPSTLLFSDFLERTIREGYVEDSVNVVVQMLNDGELGIADKVAIAIRAGRALSDYGEQDQATDILVQTTSLAPSNSYAWVTLGIVYSRQGRVEDAISAYRKALESDPNGYWANHSLAGILYRRRQWQDVVYLEQRAVQSAPDDDRRVASLARIAHAYSQLGDTVRACEVLRQAYMMQESQGILEEMTMLECTDEP